MIRNNILSICSAIVILYLSLASASTFNKIDIIHFKGLDKVVHFCMYAFFMGIILFEHRKKMRVSLSLLPVALIPVFFGALLEILQSCLTTTRTGSFFDFLFDVAGITFSIIIFLLLKRRKEAGFVR
jgi:VanZ family protein